MDLRYFATSCLFVLPLFASMEDRVSLLECKMNAVQDDTVFGRSGARFANGRPLLESGYGAWATGEFLYWKTYEGGTDIALFNMAAFPDLIGQNKKLNFDWEMGYRLGFGYSWPQDNWDLNLLFTRVAPDADLAIQSVEDGTFFHSIIVPDFVAATLGSVDWQLKLSTLDFEMGRSYFLSRFFYLRPHFGIRGAWIHQKASGFFESASGREDFSLRNDFDGAGLRIGGDSKWFFSKNWNMAFMSSLSGLYGNFKVSDRRDRPGDTHYHSDYTESLSRFLLSAQTAVSLGWETFFSEDRNHLSLSLGYELNYWWRQNQLISFLNFEGVPYGPRYSEDLSFHGLTVDMQLSF